MAIFKRISNPLYQDMSNTDTLTGLKNKNSFTVDMHNIESGNQLRYAIVTVDLNGLKNIEVPVRFRLSTAAADIKWVIFIFKTVPTRYEKRWKVLILSVTESAAMNFLLY